MIRVFYDDREIKGFVIPDSDEELDLHHKTLVDAPHTYRDFTPEEFNACKTNGVPDIHKLHKFVKP